jgi:hypothetical protein
MKKLLPVLMAAFLAASCDFFPGPDAALPVGAQGGGELTVYFEGPGGNGDGAARTLLPKTPDFTSYDLTFTDTAEVNPKPNEQRSVTASGQPVSLPVGEWNVQVDAFIGTEPDKYRAASGSSTSPITVGEGTNAPVSVILHALAISGGEPGIFSWSITYSDGTGNLAAADITLHPFSAGASTENDITIDLKSVSFNSSKNDIPAGYYDVSITLENDGGKTAGLHTTAHIYPRLTTQAAYDFTPAHFVSEVMLAGTVTVTKPAEVTLNSITVQSYRDAERTVELGQAVTVPVTPFGNGVTNATSGEWIKKIPAPGNAVYFKVIASDGTDTYTADNDAGTVVPDNGKQGISLSLTVIPLPEGSFYSLEALGAYLNSQPANDALTAYPVALAGLNLSGLESTGDPLGALFAVLGEKFVALDLSACTGTAMIEASDSGITNRQNKNKLVSVTLPDTVASIGARAFKNCSGLTAINLPAALDSLADWVFENCTGLTGVVLPETLTSIGDGVFYNCSALTSVEITRTSTTLTTLYGATVFSATSSALKIYVPTAELQTLYKAATLWSAYGAKIFVVRTATVITAWVDGEAIATSADGTPPTITRTPGVTADTNKLTINVDPPATGSYSDITWTVDTEGVTADSPPYSLPTAVSAYTFDATWKSDGTYNIGLSVTKGSNTYSTTITVTVRDQE